MERIPNGSNYTPVRPDICHTVSSSSYLQQVHSSFSYQPGLSPAKTSCTPATPATLMTVSPHLPGLDTNPHLSSTLSSPNNSKIVSQTLVTEFEEEVELRRLPPSVQHVIPLTVASNNGWYQKTFQHNSDLLQQSPVIKNPFSPHYPVPEISYQSSSVAKQLHSATFSGNRQQTSLNNYVALKPTISQQVSPQKIQLNQLHSPFKHISIQPQKDVSQIHQNGNHYSGTMEAKSIEEDKMHKDKVISDFDFGHTNKTFDERRESAKRKALTTADLIGARSLTTDQSEPTASDIFPTFQSKRKHSYSSSSDEKRDKVTKVFKKTYGVTRIYGTYGKSNNTPTTIFRSAFPSDDSEEESVINYLKSGGVTETSAPSTAPSTSSTPEPLRCRLGGVTETSAPSTAPSTSSTPEPLRCRLGRSAATKAQDLIKELAPTHCRKRSRTSSGESTASTGSSGQWVIPTAPPYKLDCELLKSLPATAGHGLKLYCNLRNDNTLGSEIHPFLFPVDASLSETNDYYTIIDKPMCFQKIADNLTSLHYYTATEVVADLRQIFENCYKYNGIDSWISKMACKIEMAMEQKILTLPYSIRDSCTLAETSPHLTLYRNVCGRRVRTPRVFTLGSKSPIMLAMEELQLYKVKEVIIIKNQQAKRNEEKLEDDTIKLAEILNSHRLIKELNSSWEFISACVMVCVCQEMFSMSFTLYELEIGLLYPQHSQYLAHLMVKLACPTKKAKELTKGEVDYTEWNVLLQCKMDAWYSYVWKYSVDEANLRFGITHEFFDMFGKWRSPLKTLLFHQLSLAERVTMLHTLCTSKTETNPSLLSQFESYESNSLRATILGKDPLDTSYIHFPLWPEEVRVYAVLPTGQIECVSRNVDELEQLIHQLNDKGQPGLSNSEQISKPPKTVLKSPNLNKLLHELQCLYDTLLIHQSHHLLVESEILRRTVPLLEKLESLEPVPPPPTPAPPEDTTGEEDKQ